ncbi:hypothetical protein GCM10009530_51280 [Microbispora corallina]|uniref:DUF6545 domain-containing protein n=1 Tax=Microbispora corallina TaxID=83302 RepID=A0ABQ4G6L2_9ACTN|nr:MAB_1171c family putative transporter [Microbispora corallina]GIH42721.1 hypothetical protein Mco01_57210 [Microbispora corallina]
MGTWLRMYGPTILAWALLVSLLSYASWRPPGLARRLLTEMLVAVAIALTVLTPAVYSAVARISGVPNLARLLGHAGMLVAVWSAQSLLRILTMSSQEEAARYRRTQVRMLAGAVTTLAVVFALAATPVDDVRFAAHYARRPWVLEYWVVYSVFLMPAYGNLLRLTWRYARLTTNPTLRLGLRLAAFGAAFGLVYQLHKTLLFGSARFGYHYIPSACSQFLDELLPLAGYVLFLVGATMPTWGPRLGLAVLLDWLQRCHTYHALRPLWLALYRASPQIALAPPVPALLDLLMLQDLGLRLYRRVIEIRDGRMTLRPYFDPAVTTAARAAAVAAGARGQRLEAVVEAATLAAALRAKARGVAAAEDPPAAAIPGGGDLTSDIAFLHDVARAHRRLRFRPVAPGHL